MPVTDSRRWIEEELLEINGLRQTIVYEYDITTGQLKCTECVGSPIWCLHVRGLVRDGKDLSNFWPTNDLVAPEYNVNCKVYVPVFPDANHWTYVELVAYSGPGGAARYQILWEDYPLKYVDENGTISPSPVVGFLNRGEGRQVIRSILIEYMWGDPRRSYECKAAHHGYAQQKAFEANIAQTPEYYYEAWSIYMTNQCLVCNTITGLDPNLIPASQGGFPSG